MTISDYLSNIKHITVEGPGKESAVYAMLCVTDPDIDYRTASLIFAEVPELYDAFERLWSEYEDYIDLLRPVEDSEIDEEELRLDAERRAAQRKQGDVSDTTKRILGDII